MRWEAYRRCLWQALDAADWPYLTAKTPHNSSSIPWEGIVAQSCQLCQARELGNPGGWIRSALWIQQGGYRLGILKDNIDVREILINSIGSRNSSAAQDARLVCQEFLLEPCTPCDEEYWESSGGEILCSMKKLVSKLQVRSIECRCFSAMVEAGLQKCLVTSQMLHDWAHLIIISTTEKRNEEHTPLCQSCILVWLNRHRGANNDAISIFLDVGAETMMRIHREVGEGPVPSTYFLITHVAPNINVSPSSVITASIKLVLLRSASSASASPGAWLTWYFINNKNENKRI